MPSSDCDGRPEDAPSATVLICTYNRADLLDETLRSLAASEVPPGITWDVLIVDNNSSDNTAEVVRRRGPAFPVPLRYLHEPRPGKSHALNSGLAATVSDYIVFTDDDVRVEPGWLAAAIEPMRADPEIAYTGGPVLPIWGAPRPRWLDAERGDLWGAIAILDYGSARFIFEEEHRIPLGANMAVRRRVLERVGGFHPALGRTGKSLLGQEQAEFFCRTRAQGERGLYEPRMVLHHHVPPARLSRLYFRRWWFWKGISRARLHQVHPDADWEIDTPAASTVMGIPRLVWRGVAHHAPRAVLTAMTGRRVAAVKHEMMLAYYVGFGLESWWGQRGSPRGGSRVPTANA